MTKQYEVLHPRKYTTAQGEKTHWMHIGKAFENTRNGSGYDVILYVLPPPTIDQNGQPQYRFLIREDDGQRQQQGQGQGQGGRAPTQHRQSGYQGGGGYGPQRGAHQDEVPMPGGDTDDIPF